MKAITTQIAVLFTRLALGVSFLSAVADRFGLWGAYGEPNVAWGNFARFVAYTGKLNWFLPGDVIIYLAWAATVLEFVLGVLLIFGLFIRFSAFLSGLLLLLFGLTMAFAVGVKAPLDYSVFSASASAFLLASYSAKSSLSIDRFRSRMPQHKKLSATA